MFRCANRGHRDESSGASAGRVSAWLLPARGVRRRAAAGMMYPFVLRGELVCLWLVRRPPL